MAATRATRAEAAGFERRAGTFRARSKPPQAAPIDFEGVLSRFPRYQVRVELEVFYAPVRTRVARPVAEVSAAGMVVAGHDRRSVHERAGLQFIPRSAVFHLAHGLLSSIRVRTVFCPILSIIEEQITMRLHFSGSSKALLTVGVLLVFAALTPAVAGTLIVGLPADVGGNASRSAAITLITPMASTSRFTRTAYSAGQLPSPVWSSITRK